MIDPKTERKRDKSGHTERKPRQNEQPKREKAEGRLYTMDSISVAEEVGKKLRMTFLCTFAAIGDENIAVIYAYRNCRNYVQLNLKHGFQVVPSLSSIYRTLDNNLLIKYIFFDA